MDTVFVLILLVLSCFTIGLGIVLFNILGNERKEKANVEELKGLREESQRSKAEIIRLKSDVEALTKRMHPFLDMEKGVAGASQVIEKMDAQRKALAAQLKTLNEAVRDRTKELSALEGDLDLHHFGYYHSHYSFASDSAYQAQLDNVREKQKKMLKEKKAATCFMDWTVNGSKTEGRKQINQTLKLMLRAFNGECDAAIARVKYNNVMNMENRIKKAFETINTLAQVQQARISPEYLDLRIQELRLAYEHQEKLQAGREEQRRIREQMKEEEQARREIEKAQDDAEREEKRAREALEKARREISVATGEQQRKMSAQISELERRLAEAEQNKARAISRAQMTRSGYVYIISNVGSFGEDVFKIGMTRRLDPQERIDELGSASVPFPFDVHAQIFCDDAPRVENALHRAFHHKRVNRVNERKEFFRVSLHEIEREARKHDANFSLTLWAEAQQYRQTLALLEEVKEPHDSPARENFVMLQEPGVLQNISPGTVNPFGS